jgi:hypothetical protein
VTTPSPDEKPVLVPLCIICNFLILFGLLAVVFDHIIVRGFFLGLLVVSGILSIVMTLLYCQVLMIMLHYPYQ